MKKWMKAMSAVLMMSVTFCLLGSVDAKAAKDDDKVKSVVRIEYEGDPVPYEERIDKDDFKVTVKLGNGDRVTLDSDMFEISPEYMEHNRRELVEVTISGDYTVNGRDLYAGKDYVYCEQPELESIEAEYDGDDLLVGGEIDPDDVEVTAYYSDGSSKKVSGWKFKSYKLRDGWNTITIYYEEDDIDEDTEIEVKAYEAELEYISATYNGAYVNVGSKINNANIKVTGVYDGDRHGRVTSVLSGWYLKNYSIKEGNNTVTVVYKKDGETYEDTINVVGRVQQSTAATVSSKNGAWEKVGNQWRWRLPDKTFLKNSWILVDGSWYYLEADSNMACSEWKNIGGSWYYFNPDGAMLKGWQVIDNQWYFLDEVDGNMYTGWKLWNGQYYYLIPGSGEMATNRWIANWYVNGDGVWTQTR